MMKSPHGSVQKSVTPADAGASKLYTQFYSEALRVQRIYKTHLRLGIHEFCRTRTAEGLGTGF